jgi:hypothetical protein
MDAQERMHLQLTIHIQDVLLKIRDDVYVVGNCVNFILELLEDRAIIKVLSILEASDFSYHNFYILGDMKKICLSKFWIVFIVLSSNRRQRLGLSIGLSRVGYG